MNNMGNVRDLKNMEIPEMLAKKPLASLEEGTSEVDDSLSESELSPSAKEKIMSIINGFSKKEKDLVVDLLPIECVYNRIGRELKGFQEREKQMKEILLKNM